MSNVCTRTGKTHQARPHLAYFGKTCERHPDWQGERYLSNGRCVSCSRTKANVANATRRSKVVLLKEAVEIINALTRGEGHYAAGEFIVKLRDLGIE